MSDTVQITLDYPIQRGEQTIVELSLRKPRSGELRGVHLGDLAQLDVTALITVLPRITTPTLTSAEVAAMAPSDLFQAGAEVAGFLLPKSMQPPVYPVG